MRRRFFLQCGIAGALSRAAGAAPVGCYEEDRGGRICSIGPGTVPPVDIAACAGHCWSIGLAYLLRGYGADVSARSLRDFAGQGNDCALADDYTRLKRCGGRWHDARGRAFTLSLNDLPSLDIRLPEGADIARLTQALSRGPLLCGAAGHTTVISEVLVWDHPTWGVRWEEIKVLDPMVPGPARALSTKEREDPFYVLQAEIMAL
ncbi:MAG: hypothetical protein KDA50_10460 [Rhodobacteraceae bacterium]|nr:hypothetical protein [Paracoccaceae bacterium]